MANKAVKFDHEKQSLADWSQKADMILNHNILGLSFESGKKLLNAMKKLAKR